MNKTPFKRIQQKLARSGMAISRVNGNTLSIASLNRAGLDYERFLSRKADWVERVRGDLLDGTRNIPTAPGDMTALFAGGLGDFWASLRQRGEREGLFGHLDYAQVMAELAQLHPSSFERGEARHAPAALQDPARPRLRDPGLGTVGGGNHFVEVQVVTELVDRRACFERGLSVGQVVLMIHTGSRDVGFHVGRRWMDKARELWPKGIRHPESRVFALLGPMADEYLAAMHAAAHYADANRALIAEMVRQRTREVFGADIEAPLLVDVPHNIVLRESVGNVHRKGATPAYAGQDLLIPGSMGHDSYLLRGLGNAQWLRSASHGAGRSMSRSEVRLQARRAPDGLGLDRVHCITRREERLIEEAPGAYKEIGEVVRAQVEEETVAVIARFSPILTFKA